MIKTCPKCKGYGRIGGLGGMEQTCTQCNGERKIEVEEETKEIDAETAQKTKPKSKTKKRRSKKS